MEQHEWERVVYDFDDSQAAIYIRDEGGIGFTFRLHSSGNPYVVVNASPEFVQGIPESYIPIVSNQSLPEVA